MQKTEQKKSSDYAAGQRDHAAGYYDKWYRYNRKDDGAEYDRGFRSIYSGIDVQIIECMSLPTILKSDRKPWQQCR